MDSTGGTSKTTLLALTLGCIGVAALLGGWRTPSERTVLFALGGIFFFAAVSFGFLVPDDDGIDRIYRDIYTDLTANHAALMEVIELQDTKVYVPDSTNASAEDGPPAWLFVPRQADSEVPSDRELEPFLVPSESGHGGGVSLFPTGCALFRRFESRLDGRLSDSPEELATQLSDGLVGLDLVQGIEPKMERSENQVTFYVRRSSLPFTEGFDHPLQSFLAVGLCVGLDRPVTAELTEGGDGRFYCQVTCEWPP